MQNTLVDRRSFSPDVLIPLSSGKKTTEHLATIAKTYGIKGEQWRTRFSADYKVVRTLTGMMDRKETTIHLLGLGDKSNPTECLAAFRHALHKLRKELGSTLLFDWSFLPKTKRGSALEAGITGCLVSGYRLDDHRSKSQKTPAYLSENAEWNHYHELSASKAEKHLAKAQQTALSMQFAMHMVDSPANHKSPRQMVAWAVASGQQQGYEVTVFDRAKLIQMGMDALLAVGQGSATPPYFILAQYQGAKKNDPTLALVGKGVTFDTGGLSIKAAANMHYMKSDMGGAAAVLGAIDLAARLKLPINLVAAVPTTENSVDGNSIRPSDVIKSYSGKTIEIIDTDAEGRLILADGLAYVIKHHKPKVVLDLATLTGSSIRALGYACGALFTQNDTLSQVLLETGDAVGERLWRLPLWDTYGDMMKSDVADIKNLSARPVAGAITAAKFLEFFTNDHPAWAHLDIAGVALAETEYGKGRLATGYGVRLLVAFMERLIANKFSL